MNTTVIADIGSGTQDILVYQSGIELENCYKMVLPSPTQNKAAEIRELTRQKTPLFLTGRIMGGGACTGAIKSHIKAGLTVYAAEYAAKTINDDLEKVKSMGIILTENPPDNAVPVVMGDVSLDQWKRFFELWSISFPTRFAVAVQDHGESTELSNRTFRMNRWREFVDRGGRLEELAYTSAPKGLTRMKAVEESLEGKVMLMDTGTAAICGALEDPVVAAREEEGVVLVNLGNSHALIALVQKGRLLGLCEHHTSQITPGKLSALIERLITGVLTHEEVYNDKGHGTALANGFSGLSFSPMVAVTGPRRNLSRSLQYYNAVPHGDMMLAGCFGMLRMGLRTGFI